MGPRAEVRIFADFMEEKLAENDFKGGWEGESLESLLGRALQEHLEVNRALHDWRMDKNPEMARKVIRECADAANFYMMVASNITDASRLVSRPRKAPFTIDTSPLVIDELTCKKCMGYGIGVRPDPYICTECGGTGRKEKDESTQDTATPE